MELCALWIVSKSQRFPHMLTKIPASRNGRRLVSRAGTYKSSESALHVFSALSSARVWGWAATGETYKTSSFSRPLPPVSKIRPFPSSSKKQTTIRRWDRQVFRLSKIKVPAARRYVQKLITRLINVWRTPKLEYVFVMVLRLWARGLATWEVDINIHLAASLRSSNIRKFLCVLQRKVHNIFMRVGAFRDLQKRNRHRPWSLERPEKLHDIASSKISSSSSNVFLLPVRMVQLAEIYINLTRDALLLSSTTQRHVNHLLFSQKPPSLVLMRFFFFRDSRTYEL